MYGDGLILQGTMVHVCACVHCGMLIGGENLALATKRAEAELPIGSAENCVLCCTLQ